MNIITIKDLCFQYETAVQEDALKNVNLQVQQGECLVLTGESGCGKTTLIRCLNGLIPEFYEGELSGELYFRETSYEGLEKHEISAHISTVFQDPRSQFFTVNSTDEVAFGCENLSFSTERINENVDKAFSHLSIDRLKGRSLFTLSSGEKQKLAVASVYAMSTDVILMDEPTANLDESSIQDMRKMLSALKAEGKTLIVSEHRLSWLDGIADRYVYMEQGEIRQIWSTGDVKQLSVDKLKQYGLRSFREVSMPSRTPPLDNGEKELSCEDLTVSYGRQVVLRDSTLRLTWGAQGKIVGVVGKNGAGKTTLAKALCGLLAPKSGSIALNGKKVNPKELCKNTYMVMQDADYQLFTESVLHEIQLADRKRQSKPHEADHQIITEVLNRFGLEGCKNRHPLSLSGGQKQRVTIAAALAAGADVLALDEPTSGLDGRNMQNLKGALREIKAQGKLILIVTHDTEFLNDLADQVIEVLQQEEVIVNKRKKGESPLKGILNYATQRKALIRISVVLSVLSSAFGLLPYISVAVLLGRALDNQLTLAWAVGLSLSALLGYFLKFYLFSKSTLCSHKAAYEIIRNIRCTIMKKMSKMSMGAVQEKASGEFKQLVIDDTDRLEGQIAHAIPEMTASILIPLMVFAYLLFVDWRMALASLGSAILGNIILYSMMFGRGEMMKEYMGANGNMNATIVEYVNGMEVIRMFNQTASSMGRFKAAVLKVRDVTTAWYRHCYPYMSIGQAVMTSSISFVLPVGVAILSRGTVTLNEVILCLLLSMGLAGSLQAMIEFWQDISAIYEIQPRIQALLDAEELPVPAEPKHPTGAGIELKDVHFSYGDAEVIHGASFTANEGAITALVGPSGSGKSTLAKLIARFWDVNAGAIQIGGVDVRYISLSELSDQISYVSQDNFLFNMSLRDNIRIGKPSASDEEVEQAAEQAGCGDFINQLPQGYDTSAGDAGSRLSGGERQRLAIARAILKDAPIVILDEATAFTDPENEDKIQRSIDRLTKGKTLIVIAHRLSTIMHADQIIVLEDGEISAKGTHEQLLSSSQTYLDMWKAHISAMDWSISQEVTQV